MRICGEVEGSRCEDEDVHARRRATEDSRILNHPSDVGNEFKFPRRIRLGTSILPIPTAEVASELPVSAVSACGPHCPLKHSFTPDSFAESEDIGSISTQFLHIRDQVLDEQNSVYDDGQLEVPHDVGFTWSYPNEDDESQTDPTDEALPHLMHDEDDPDPFFINEEVQADRADLAEFPDHVAVIHATVSRLHLQFHLPCIACNALLAIFSLLLLFFNSNSSLPFTTLHSGNCILSVDKPVHTLPVCLTCRDVYLPATSPLCHDTCTSCNIDLFLPGQTLQGNAHALKTPIVKYPYLPLSEQISSILMIPGIEDVLDGWRGKSCSPGIYMDIFDGSICRTKLKGPDGKLFFSNDWNEQHGPNNELCLGVNLGVDCPTGFRTFKVTSCHLTHRALPPSRFATSLPNTDTGLPAHPPQTNVEQCCLGEEYRNLLSPNAQKIFVKDFATHYSQLSHLPYFDLVKQVVIDPMHNLFLGLVKMHFYHIWVQGKILRPNHELGMLHSMLADFIIPGSCSKLPTDIGTPAGGSLTADQWLLLATIPQIWSTFLPSNASDKASSHRIAVIERAETEKQQEVTRKANNKVSLAEAKKCGKEAYETEKAWIAQEKITITEAKQCEKLQQAAAKQAEKAQQAGAAKVSKKRKASSQDIQDLPEGQLHGLPPPPGDHIEQLPNDLQMPEDK
ncbi:hypothetical protein M404DRAFT_33208 [Pisolithus tinctorius Marx 270]|uniref:Uncharacterized protein n=1 Tax=Pisolithus tinctorius Marx 270 TaxID=870435 RepID=A0A0C3N600_PISTI|nr:hypothetical protein M404DRAFT_33208 [Pisolithus tinctorius Marx 270]